MSHELKGEYAMKKQKPLVVLLFFIVFAYTNALGQELKVGTLFPSTVL